MTTTKTGGEHLSQQGQRINDSHDQSFRLPHQNSAPAGVPCNDRPDGSLRYGIDIERFRSIVANDVINPAPGGVSEFEKILQRLLMGETLRQICKSMGVPYVRVLAWLIADKRRYSIYRRALAEATPDTDRTHKDKAAKGGQIII